MSRPQVGIERLADGRRLSHHEQRESMNCKSCRKRKIKCNRLRPTCEACQVFQCPCIYDAVPKKRGPKTDVLEALLKRVDGLERRLKDDKKTNSHSPDSNDVATEPEDRSNDDGPQQLPVVDTSRADAINDSALYSPPPSIPSPTVLPDVLLDTYFARVHGKPYFILDETILRQRLQLGQVPSYLLYAIYAVSARYTSHPSGYNAAISLGEDYAKRARAEVDVDDPTIDNLQSLLLLAAASLAAGKGKKAYMLLATGVGMALALELNRELEFKNRATPAEREMRRRLFWTCFLMDRFTASGSKRPSSIAEKTILLRLPAWSPNPAALPIEGEFFQNGSNLQSHGGSVKKCQGNSGMFIDIVRILGVTNRYLAAGGVKGDSHFPWHSSSRLSAIRQDLDTWASGTQEVFSSIDALFGNSESTTLVLSKLIYHLIHCLIYRPFLPIDLAELAGTGQHQSWQIESTQLCFLHANAIAELVDLGKQSGSIEWPAFVAYCICTAGTVHVHGTHYKGGREGEVFSGSADFLSREMQQLSELRYLWGSVEHQRETLKMVYECHSDLVKSLESNPMRYSPVFQLEDFFDRYCTLGQFFDGAHISFADFDVNSPRDMFSGDGLYTSVMLSSSNTGGGTTSTSTGASKRKASSSSRKRRDSKEVRNNTRQEHGLISPTFMTDTHKRQSVESLMPHTSLPGPDFLHAFAAPSIPTLSDTPFSPPYNFNSHANANIQDSYDPMFGMPQMSHSLTGGLNGFPYDQAMTPGARSTGSHGTGGAGEEKDPFLTLLEQLAENEHSRGGPSDLDFFLSGNMQ